MPRYCSDFRPPLGHIHKPALAVWGSKDWANLRAARALAGAITGAGLRIIAGAD